LNLMLFSYQGNDKLKEMKEGGKMISLNTFSRLVSIGGAGLIAISAILFLLGFIIGETEVMSEILEKAGIMAEIAAIAAFALWVIRVLLMQLKKRK
jgi:hypothetical protein